MIFETVKMIAGSAGGSFAIVAGFILLVFWVYGKFVQITARHAEIERRHDKFEDMTSSIRNDIASIHGDMQYVKSTLNTLLDNMQRSTGKKSAIQAHSPLSLTDYGHEMAQGLKAERAIALNWDAIKAKMDAELTSRNPYDIQTYCLEKIPVAPEAFFSKALVEHFKIYAFVNGLTLFECMKVVGLIVRDKYFECEGISLAELDPKPETTQPA